MMAGTEIADALAKLSASISSDVAYRSAVPAYSQWE
jgi:hypothetical protein